MNKLMYTVSSQFKLLPYADEKEISSRSVSSAAILKNDTFSFQVLFRAPTTERWTPLSVRIICDGIPLECYKVGFVPITNIAYDNTKNGYVSEAPGLFPNPLFPRYADCEISRISPDFFAEIGETNHLFSDGSFSSLWVTVNPHKKLLPSENKTVDIELVSLTSGETLEKSTFELEILDAVCDDDGIFYTNWFHVDCLCDYYKTEPYDERFYYYFRTFVKNMVKHRQNTILVPTITPALDTPMGKERKNVQLVDITKKDGKYSFCFDKLKKFIDICDECGIKYFEHPPIFSQWGAQYAVNIYSTDGKKLFGWETDATDPNYTEFLRCYLMSLISFEKQCGYEGRFIFHISDEPTNHNKSTYKLATDSVIDILSDRKVVDALIDINIYKEGLVKTPVATIDKADEFGENCDDFWLYYTGGISKEGLSNRLIPHTSARTRVLGLQLWYYGAKGFLHWGYNYCYDYLSCGFFDPICEPCGYKNYPGASYLAYYTPDGAIPSICEKLMAEAMDDAASLTTLEKLIGKERVCKLCEDILGEKISTTTIPHDDELIKLRFAINHAIFDAKKIHLMET